MIKRTISALIALPLLFIVLYAFPNWAIAVTLGVVIAIAVHEMLYNTGFLRDRFFLVISCIYGFVAPLWFYFDLRFSAVAGIFVYIAAMFVYGLFHHQTITFEKIAGTFFATYMISFFLSAIMKILVMDNGDYMIILPFAASWLTDTSAYFAGRFFGRHKLAPDISPKKTVEGAVGGVFGGALGCMLVALIYQVFFAQTSNYLLFGLIGLICSLAGQIGDLSLSLIKRNFGIKDYGTIMPGHGGVLDRFDSVLFAAPMCEALLFLLPSLL